MRFSKIVAVVVCCGWVSWAQNAEALKTQIGILPLELSQEGEDRLRESAAILKSSLEKVGGYQVHSAEALTEGFKRIKQRLPRYCDDPGCASAVGTALQLDRMLYGGIDLNADRYAVLLTMVDVPSRQIVEKVALEGEQGVALPAVMDAAVARLHGRDDGGVSGAKVRRYFGPEVHREKQLLISAATCLAAGVIWSAANGSLTGRDGDNRETPETVADATDRLSGIATGEDQIPLFGRPGALANTYVAESNDAYGVFFNPAGLPWAAGGEIAFGYQQRFLLNNFAASFVNKAGRDLGFGQGFLYTGDSLANTVYFLSSIGYRFNSLLSWIPPLAIGATVKLRSMSLAPATSLDAATGNSFGIGLNLGLQMDVAEHIRGGILFRNVPMINVNRNTYTNEKYTEGDAPLLQIGGTFKANYATFLICEVRMPLIDDQPWEFAGAIERLLFRVIQARIGIAREADFDTPWQFTGGIGLDIKTGNGFVKYFKVDGSYEYNTVEVFAHVMNVSFRVGF